MDSLDSLGMEEVMASLKRTGNREISEQCNLYERELNQEDADSDEDVSNAKMRHTGVDKRAKLRQRQAEALKQQEEQRMDFGANREIFNKTEEAKENRPEEKKTSTLAWRNGDINGVDHKETNGVDSVAPAPTKKIPEPLKIQSENVSERESVSTPVEDEEEHKVLRFSNMQ